jgi:hypothetical protein
MAFSRNTQLAACNLLQWHSHSGIDSLMLRLGVDRLSSAPTGENKEKRLNALFRHIQQSPNAAHDGKLVTQLLIEEAAILLKDNKYVQNSGNGQKFLNSLNADGFSIVDGNLRAAFPPSLDLPAADDEVHQLLAQYNLRVSLGHLDQAIASHAAGLWAAANSQLRTFYESFFDEIALLIVPNCESIKAGETRRQKLAEIKFLDRNLNEWSDDGKNFVNGTFKRLHPDGSHPGLSDEEDSTFRLHLMVLNARLFLRRLRAGLSRSI